MGEGQQFHYELLPQASLALVVWIEVLHIWSSCGSHPLTEPPAFEVTVTPCVIETLRQHSGPGMLLGFLSEWLEPLVLAAMAYEATTVRQVLPLLFLAVFLFECCVLLVQLLWVSVALAQDCQVPVWVQVVVSPKPEVVDP